MAVLPTEPGARGRNEVTLVISDVYGGLRAAIQAVLVGTASEHCRVHFLRTRRALMPRDGQFKVVAPVHTIFTLPEVA